MVANKKMTGRSASMPLGVMVGTLVSVVITVVASAVITSMILEGKVDPGSIGAWAMVTLSVSAVIGPLVADMMIKRRRLLVSASVGASYYLTLLSIAILLFDGVSSGAFVGAVIIMSCSSLVGLITLRGASKSSRISKMRRYR